MDVSARHTIDVNVAAGASRRNSLGGVICQEKTAHGDVVPRTAQRADGKSLHPRTARDEVGRALLIQSVVSRKAVAVHHSTSIFSFPTFEEMSQPAVCALVRQSDYLARRALFKRRILRAASQAARYRSSLKMGLWRLDRKIRAFLLRRGRDPVGLMLALRVPRPCPRNEHLLQTQQLPAPRHSR